MLASPPYSELLCAELEETCLATRYIQTVEEPYFYVAILGRTVGTRIAATLEHTYVIIQLATVRPVICRFATDTLLRLHQISTIAQGMR